MPGADLPEDLMAAWGSLGYAKQAIGEVFSATLEPWDVFRQVLRHGLDWITGEIDQEFVSDAAVFLMAGGLAMLSLLILVILAGNAFSGPAAPVPFGGPRDERLRLQPLGTTPGRPPTSGRAPKVPGGETIAKTPAIDRPIPRIVQAGLGEPRIVKHGRRSTRIRLYRCRGCLRAGDASPASDGQGCSAERDFLKTIFRETTGRSSVGVVERSCRRWGDVFCEFEVSP